MISKRITLALLLAALAATMIATLGTQSNASVGGASAPGLEGSWIDTVTPASGAPFMTLSSYARGGAFVTAPPPLANPINRSSTGHGTWERTGGHEFTYTFVALRYNSTQQLLGSTRVRSTLTLNGAGDEYDGVSSVESFDAAGNPQPQFNSCSTIHGRRINVEPPLQTCQ